MKDMGPAGGKIGGVCGPLEDGVGVCVRGSEGEKPSGLPWWVECDGEPLRLFEDAFLRTGRIQGGRDVNASPIS
jgi:hypothetical protein